jgi:hypothetical protein
MPKETDVATVLDGVVGRKYFATGTFIGGWNDLWWTAMILRFKIANFDLRVRRIFNGVQALLAYAIHALLPGSQIEG